MTFQAQLLGSGGGIPSTRRATCSALLRSGTHGLLIDAGTGVAHLVADPSLVEGLEQVDIVLTHFHLDHLFGLPFVPSVAFPAAPRIHAPGERLYGEPSRALLERLLLEPFLAPGWDLPRIASSIEEIGDEPLELGPFTIATRTQLRHSAPTLALNVNGELAYCTDTEYDEGNVDFARGCRTLVHEAWHTTATAAGVKGHASGADAGRVADATGAERLVLIHIAPTADEDALLADARTTFPATTVGTDLLAL